MRLITGLIASVLALASCSENTTRIGAGWDCAPIAGVEEIAVASAPAYVLVGEFVETSEAPAAFAELACRLARADRKLFVGYLEYVDGATDAETRMRERLDELIALGAPIVVEQVGEGREWTALNRSDAEQRWARSIAARVQATGAERALILLPRPDAMAARIRALGERFAGYAPMATHLPEGEVLSLEISTRVSGDAFAQVRRYEAMQDGFHGEIVLASLTRPTLPVVMATTTPNRMMREDPYTLRGVPRIALGPEAQAIDRLQADLHAMRSLRTAFAAVRTEPGALEKELSDILIELDAETARLEKALEDLQRAATDAPNFP